MTRTIGPTLTTMQRAVLEALCEAHDGAAHLAWIERYLEAPHGSVSRAVSELLDRRLVARVGERPYGTNRRLVMYAATYLGRQVHAGAPGDLAVRLSELAKLATDARALADRIDAALHATAPRMGVAA